MVEKYFDGKFPEHMEKDNIDDDIISMATSLRDHYENQMEKFQFSNALSEVWKFIARSNKYIDETMPWSLSRDPEKTNRLACVLYNLCEALRIISVLIIPFMPNTAPIIQQQIGASSDVITWDSANKWGLLSHDAKIKKGALLFPRIDVQKELSELNEYIK